MSTNKYIGDNHFVGDVFLDTQDKIDVFGKKNHTGIIGNLKIFGYAVKDVSAMSGMNSVTGNVTIIDTGLISLEGLDFAFVDGDMYISSNNFLLDLSGLNNLVIVSGDFSLHSHHILRSLSGLNNLSSVTGQFNISCNEKLTDFSSIIMMIANQSHGEIRIYDNSKNPDERDLIEMITDIVRRHLDKQ